MTTDLTTLWHTNRRWRNWMDANTKFVTPDTLDCLRYLSGECHEVRDLWMRQEKPGHARNNERDSTIEQELADVVMLALTALDEPPEPLGAGAVVFDVDYLCHFADDAVMECRDEKRGRWGASVEWVIDYVLAYPALDLAAELDRCWRRLAVKHGGMRIVLHLTSLGLTADEWDELTKDHTWPTPWEESA